MPTVSVIAAAHNQGQHIHKAIQSVLTQTFDDFELIVTDDASTDDTLSVIELFSGDQRLKILSNNAQDGYASALSRAGSISQGKYISWLNCNDVQERHYLDTLVSHLAEHPSVDGVFGRYSVIDDSGELIDDPSSISQPTESRQILNSIFRGTRPLYLHAGLVKRDSVMKAGHVQPEYSHCYADELITNLLFNGSLHVVSDVVVRSRKSRDASDFAKFNRHNFETFEFLNLYLQQITTSAELLAIFPEIKELGLPVDDEFISFHLSLIALSCEQPGQKLFGLNLLHQLMKDLELVRLLNSKCGFRYQDLFDFEDSVGIFNIREIQSELIVSALPELTAQNVPALVGLQIEPIEGYSINYQNMLPGWTPEVGIFPREGPHDDYNIPFAFHWCAGPVCAVRLVCDRTGPHMLVIDCQNLMFESIKLKVIIDGEEIGDFDLRNTSGGDTVLIKRIVHLKKGKHECGIRSGRWQANEADASASKAFILRDIRLWECF